MPLFLFFCALLAWATLGSPKQDAANIFWGDNPAPWEQVDAFFYPSRSNLLVDVRRLNLRSLDECRNWVREQARQNGDSSLSRGSYECGVGFLGTVAGSLRMYRRTVR